MNEGAFRQGSPLIEIAHGGPPWLIAHAMQRNKIISDQLFIVQLGGLGFLPWRENPKCLIIPKIRRNEHHIDRRALANRELPSAGEGIEQLRGGRGGVVGSKIVQDRNGERREHADN